MSKLAILKEFWGFMKINKRWWLAPIFVMLVLVGILVIFAETSALAPFLYPLF